MYIMESFLLVFHGSTCTVSVLPPYIIDQLYSQSLQNVEAYKSFSVHSSIEKKKLLWYMAMLRKKILWILFNFVALLSMHSKS